MTAASSDHLNLDAIVAFADGEMPLVAYQRAAAHVSRCPQCDAEVNQQVVARSWLRAAGSPAMPTSLLDSLKSIPVAVPGLRARSTGSPSIRHRSGHPRPTITAVRASPRAGGSDSSAPVRWWPVLRSAHWWSAPTRTSTRLRRTANRARSLSAVSSPFVVPAGSAPPGRDGDPAPARRVVPVQSRRRCEVPTGSRTASPTAPSPLGAWRSGQRPASSRGHCQTERSGPGPASPADRHVEWSGRRLRRGSTGSAAPAVTGHRAR